MKYILTTGCSFTNNIRLNPDAPLEPVEYKKRSWPYYLQQELGNEYTVLNYGGATNDNVSMCRIILYHIDRLLKDNIAPENIKVIIQWSAATRQSIYINRQLTKETHRLGHTLVYHNNWETTPGVFYLTGGHSPPTGPDSAIELFGIENAIKYWEAEIMWNNTVNTTMHWLELWLLLEKTCEQLGITPYYMSMRDIFSYQSSDNFFPRSITPKYDTWMKNVEVLKPYLDKLPINSNRYWHHNQYKGLLEWTIDNRRNDIPMFQEFEEFNASTFEEYLVAAGHDWGHPSAEMMNIFVKTQLRRMIGL